MLAVGPYQSREGQYCWIIRGPGNALDGAVADQRASNGVRGVPHQAQQTGAGLLAIAACRPGNSLAAS